MKILVLGASGQVGHELLPALTPIGEVTAAARTPGKNGQVDLSDRASLERTLDTSNADIVVNAAAYTAVDRAEDDAAAAQRINGDALADIGAWAKKNNRLVVHYSTDYVFDGEGKRHYRETDPTSPLGVYGQTKLAGEIALRDSGCDHFIFRTAWVYAARGKNFLLTMLKVGAERDEVRVVNDQHGTPTPARLIADTTAAILRRWSALDGARKRPVLGTYHLCANGECTWYDFARTIFADAQAAGLMERAPSVVPIATADYPTRATRPRYSVLDTAKIRDTFGVDLADWKEGLRKVIGELAKNNVKAPC
ncbi:MAG TPA: dTDP-4-dehydrorhamnose reductase [Rudaea sp.]|jgi:dTDP-4-dehydrorhamnose reductase|nr:dTDP-4-dehydrorhamnose reductase [Rudaea sp.]